MKKILMFLLDNLGYFFGGALVILGSLQHQGGWTPEQVQIMGLVIMIGFLWKRGT